MNYIEVRKRRTIMTKTTLTPEEEERVNQLIHTMAVLQEKWAEKFENPSLPSSLEAIDQMLATLRKELDEIDPTTYEVWTVDPNGTEHRHLSCVNDFKSCQEKMNNLLDQ